MIEWFQSRKDLLVQIILLLPNNVMAVQTVCMYELNIIDIGKVFNIKLITLCKVDSARLLEKIVQEY